MIRSKQLLGISFLALGLLAGGCTHEREPKALTKKGVIKSISLKNRSAQIVTDDKLGNKLELAGLFTDATTVTINGKPAQFGDIHTGDQVEVTAYRKDKKSKGPVEDPDFIATKVAVSRPNAFQPQQ